MKVDITQFKAACDCGREHKISLKEILIEPGALQRLPEVIARLGVYSKVAVLCDTNTASVAGQEAARLCGAALIELDAAGLHADENAVVSASKQLAAGTDLLVAAGSGTIHDITRYLANDRGISFVSVPTAPSVDGFVSTVAAMTWHGFKVTFPAVSPIAVVADSNILAASPKRLIASGAADLLGKYTALLDWKVSHLLTGEYLCNRVVELETQALEKIVGMADEIRTADRGAVEELTYALILSGLAMQMVGNSRPASGAEHHLSHLWEMHVINPDLDALHGEKVGVALALACEEYHKLLSIGDEETSQRLIPYSGIPQAYLKDRFGSLYESLAKENTADPLLGVDDERLCAVFPKIKQLVKEIPGKEEIHRLLLRCGCLDKPAQLGLDPAALPESIVLSPFVRNRLTLMRVMKRIDTNGNA